MFRVADPFAGLTLRGSGLFSEVFWATPAFFPENRSDNISLRFAGIIGIYP